MSDIEYLVAVSSFIPFGPARIKLLLSYFGSAKKIWQAEKSKLIKLGLGEQRTADFVKYREELNCQKYFAKLEKLSIGCFTFSDKAYPPNLKDLPNAPIVLYIKGKLKVSDINAVAIVGSRKMTAYGREVTGKFSSELASFGVTVVSGLARGIDTEAHQAALSVGGRTIAVLGCGLDLVYPPENTQLASEIVHSGALLSEYPLGYPAIPLNFASRNRIISGLAKAVLVIDRKSVV